MCVLFCFLPCNLKYYQYVCCCKFLLYISIKDFFFEYQVCPCYVSGLTGRKGGSSLIKKLNFQANKTKPNRWRVCFPVNNVFNCKAQTGKHSLTPTSMCSASLLRFALLCQKALETDSPCKIHTGPDRIVWLQLSVCSCYSCSWIGSVESRNSLTGLH